MNKLIVKITVSRYCPFNFKKYEYDVLQKVLYANTEKGSVCCAKTKEPQKTVDNTKSQNFAQNRERKKNISKIPCKIS